MKISKKKGDMEDKSVSISEIEESELFRRLRSMDLIDETELRNIQIRNEYKELRWRNSAAVCVEMLMEKYSVSDSALNSILFRKKQNI